MTGQVVEVEADIANGLVGMILVGLPDTALREARDRIHAAIVNSGEEWPQRKITVGLSPASLPKRGSWFDLAIAVGLLSGGPNCSAVAIAGGGGVASGDGTIYFLSPELLNGASNGTAGKPNLYVVRPGSAPRYVTTLEIEQPRRGGCGRPRWDLQLRRLPGRPSGDFAVFSSALPLTPTAQNAGFTQVYRYDASSETLDCASCNPTAPNDEGEGTLSDLGLGLTNNGRVFFDSTEALAARDEDEKTDVYEWEAQSTVEAEGE